MDEYIAGFPQDVQAVLERIRRTIRKAAPDAEETISYRIPTFMLKGTNLVYFAAFKKHIGLYPAPIDTAEFKDELSVYAAGKGTVRFSLEKPIPLELISRMVSFMAQEHSAKAATRGKKQ
jgi:uncharacterized protein YdhG (YjbR/CyaY superfamily)